VCKETFLSGSARSCAKEFCQEAMPKGFSKDLSQGSNPITVAVPKNSVKELCQGTVPKNYAKELCHRAIPRSCVKELCQRAVPRRSFAKEMYKRTMPCNCSKELCQGDMPRAISELGQEAV
jgi:hypothetical protein